MRVWECEGWECEGWECEGWECEGVRVCECAIVFSSAGVTVRLDEVCLVNCSRCAISAVLCLTD